MRTAVSTMRVSHRCHSFLCCFGTFSPSLVCPSFLSLPSSCCSLCQAHHVCVRMLPPLTIEHVATPWFCDIHSLFPVPPEEAGERKRTMRCQFLNPLILFFFCPNGAVLFFPLPPALLEAAPILIGFFSSLSFFNRH